jgi:hypothetical protein
MVAKEDRTMAQYHISPLRKRGTLPNGFASLETDLVVSLACASGY